MHKSAIVIRKWPQIRVSNISAELNRVGICWHRTCIQMATHYMLQQEKDEHQIHSDAVFSCTETIRRCVLPKGRLLTRRHSNDPENDVFTHFIFG